MKFEQNHFETEAEALAEIASMGYHPLIADVPPGEEPPHWHEFPAFVYVLSGEADISVHDTGSVHRCTAGTRIEVPARTIHAERTGSGLRVAIGLGVPAEQMTQPINKPVEELTGA